MVGVNVSAERIKSFVLLLPQVSRALREAAGDPREAMFSLFLVKSTHCRWLQYVHVHEGREGDACCAERAVPAPESDPEA